MAAEQPKKISEPAKAVHADPPPSIVPECSGLRYITGPQIGKGGFAICHRAEVLDAKKKSTGRIVALKIVKSKMEPAKLAQKVRHPILKERDRD